ncbi:potassium transporter KefG [Oleiphilus sp. HI0071]|jgi:putative NADPH-quinone reductase|nr:potassium transporter KefG [Oleiphilus sp. HI0065]KZY81265.1 potassium transporter KefG [Oleiphilus sp. HI0071]KZY92596.1 potassium transporter KefG [Oleiphilus sp. HI0073]KZZ17197.1 potassium transporter KefG [Oleiphilus sp. HI0080]KZZ50551.1 potassium transporter KefG [Oleiphilus sp. HI0118]KZZ52861.1 potassium transporter KefG [Oleiphilus sp. HI0122]KZZ70564.1 potassium transporter KefG [Oleiphilus sp. HI0130]KZZ82496.1 potassium transporter KefG [Oleiphilus sp. HI0133]
MAMTKKVLVLFAHPAQSDSEVNMPLFSALSSIERVTTVDLYAEYPRFRIDVEKEQQRLLAHDIIVFQFPMYWYSSPAMIKEWQDLVLEYGFAYGKAGDQLKNKSVLIMTSAGAQQDAYQTEGLNQYPLRELLRPFEQMAHLCQMHYLPPFVLFGSRTAHEELRIDGHIKQAKTLIQAIQKGQLDHTSLGHYALSNDYFQESEAQR